MKLSPFQVRVAQMLGPLEGEKIAGGCDLCDAYQTVEPIAAGAWRIRIHHDAACPVLARKVVK